VDCLGSRLQLDTGQQLHMANTEAVKQQQQQQQQQQVKFMSYKKIGASTW
jgi:hypothetical protein